MKTFCLSCLALIALSACTTPEIGVKVQPYEEENIQVSISFSPYTMAPMTRANVAISTLSNLLDVFIIDGDEVMDFHQVKADNADAFGTITTSLNKTKTYTIYAVAHKGNGAATLDDGVLTFPDNKITDTFFYSGTFSPATSASVSCVMHRIVGMFKLTFTDALPDNLAKVRFSITGSGLAYNVNGATTSPGEKISVINNPSSSNDGSTTFKVYCLADDDISTIDVTVTAMDGDDEVIETKTFEDVPLQAGYTTAYRGTFFVTTETTVGFTAPDSWESFDEEEF